MESGTIADKNKVTWSKKLSNNKHKSEYVSIKYEMRLAIIEYMIAILFRRYYLVIGATPEQVRASHDRLRRLTRGMPVPGASHDKSDHLAKEWEAAVEHMLSMIEMTSTAGAARND